MLAALAIIVALLAATVGTTHAAPAHPAHTATAARAAYSCSSVGLPFIASEVIYQDVHTSGLQVTAYLWARDDTVSGHACYLESEEGLYNGSGSNYTYDMWVGVNGVYVGGGTYLIGSAIQAKGTLGNGQDATDVTGWVSVNESGCLASPQTQWGFYSGVRDQASGAIYTAPDMNVGEGYCS